MESASEMPKVEFPDLMRTAVFDAVKIGYERANMQVRAALVDFGLDPERVRELLESDPSDPYLDGARRALSVRFMHDPYLVESMVEVEKLMRQMPSSREARTRKQIIASFNRRNISDDVRFPQQ
jgi:hypothetical protein